MKKIEIFDEENSITIDDQFDTTNFTFYPEDKKFEVSRSIKDDYFYSKQIIEYKISANPIEIQMRTLESSSEPPKEYSIKDGVVLESELIKNKAATRFFPDRIKKLKEDVEWNAVPLLGGYCEVNLYILSKHPEIISKENYRKFIRQAEQRINIGLSKIENYLKEKDETGLKIIDGKYGRMIWYPESELGEKEREKYCELPEEKREKSEYGKKIEYVEKFKEALFNEKSSNYCGISENEFGSSLEILKYLNKLLNQKEASKIEEPVKKLSKTKGLIISLILTLFISWIISWFVDINPFLIFILVQSVSFIQSVIGGWLEKFF